MQGPAEPFWQKYTLNNIYNLYVTYNYFSKNYYNQTSILTLLQSCYNTILNNYYTLSGVIHNDYLSLLSYLDYSVTSINSISGLIHTTYTKKLILIMVIKKY